MRRIELILAVVAAMAVMMVVVAAPAMADVRITNNGNHSLSDNNGNHGFFFVNNNDNFNDNFLNNEVANESETGDVTATFTVTQTGNNSNQCVTPLQFGNTGSNQNAQGFASFNSPFDNNGFFDVFGTDVELTGGDFTFAPVLNASCDQSVEQSSAASSF